MPILKKEPDIYPVDLLENQQLLSDPNRQWWCIYTHVRREKDLMRKLTSKSVAFYAPVIPKRYRSPAGRIRTSFIPLFANYVFMFGDESDRYEAMTTNCVAKYTIVEEHEQLVEDLRKIRAIIEADIPLTPEANLTGGDRCRIKNGPFRDYEGIVIRRGGKTCFLVSVRLLEQSVAMEIDEGLLEPI